MSALPIMMMVVGTAVKGIGEIRAARDQSATERYNANVAKMEAEAIRRTGAYEEAKLKREKAKTTGKQRAGYAKAGVRFEGGSPLEVMADTAAQYEMDIAATKYNTQIGASRAEYESKYRKQMAKRHMTAGYYRAGGTLLTGMGKIGYGA